MNLVNHFEAMLKYCERQNGLPYCKNCGLDKDDIELIKQRDAEIIQAIAEYSGINDIQTKELIKIIKGLIK